MTQLPDSITSHMKYSNLSNIREEAASGARDAQAMFRRYKGLVVLGTVIAAIAGGLILYSIDLDPNPAVPHILHQLDDNPWRQILIGIQAFCLAVVAFSGHRLVSDDVNAEWRELRLRAEDKRLEIERAALEIGHAISPSVFVQAGDGFLSFADKQRKYLTKRGAKARKSMSNLGIVGAIVAAVVAAGASLASVDSAWVLAFVGLVGVAAPAVGVAVKSWSEATRENQRAALHRQSADQLSDLLTDGQRFKDAIDAHDLPTALTYMEEVFAILRADHEGFAKLRSDTGKDT